MDPQKLIKGTALGAKIGNKMVGYLDTIPNHIRIKLDTRFFEGGAPETEEIFRNGVAEFGNNLHVLAVDEPEIVLVFFNMCCLFISYYYL